MLVKQYKIGNAIIRIHGDAPENLKQATEIFMKKVMKCSKAKNGKELKAQYIMQS